MLTDKSEGIEVHCDHIPTPHHDHLFFKNQTHLYQLQARQLVSAAATTSPSMAAVWYVANSIMSGGRSIPVELRSGLAWLGSLQAKPATSQGRVGAELAKVTSVGAEKRRRPIL